MSRPRRVLLPIVLLIATCPLTIAYAIPSGGVYPPEFTYRNGDWYDSWDFNRNYHGGSDGFLPNVAYESLRSDRELAYTIGEAFNDAYANRVERAEAILQYVQARTEYGYDEDNVVRNGVAQAEWAWNADEMAHRFTGPPQSVAIGDCEDMAFLGATLYVASNIEVALVDAPGHVALLIWLPEYDNANYYWDVPNDGRAHGWIWVEATGETNPLGWTPPDFADGDWTAHILGFSRFTVAYAPRRPQTEDEVTVTATIESQLASISTVTLRYETVNASREVPMVTTASRYEATIPQQPDGTEVTCTVQVTDDAAFTSQREFAYVVGQGVQLPPFLFEAGIILVILCVLFVAGIARSR